jgi:hypothetical protein
MTSLFEAFLDALFRAHLEQTFLRPQYRILMGAKMLCNNSISFFLFWFFRWPKEASLKVN